MSFPWPLSDGVMSEYCQSPLSKPPRNGQSQCETIPSRESREATESSETGAIPKSHMPLRSESQNHEITSLVSRYGAMHDVRNERVTVSLDLERRSTQSEEVRHSEDNASSLRARLRGGGGQRQAARFGWLRRAQNVDQKLGKGKGKTASFVVTYKGREIGPPQPVSALNVLPPASRFVKQLQDDASLNPAIQSPFDNGHNTLGNHLLSPPRCDHLIQVRPKSPPLPPPSALLATSFRPVTTNPFAGTYGNPDIVRVGSAFRPIDCTTAGSLVDRPSARNGLQTGYLQVPALSRRILLYSSSEALQHMSEPQGPGVESAAQNVLADRK